MRPYSVYNNGCYPDGQCVLRTEYAESTLPFRRLIQDDPLALLTRPNTEIREC